MNQKTILLAGGAVALLGVAWLMTSGGGGNDDETGGTSGGGLNMAGQGVSMAPSPIDDTGVSPGGYTLTLPENPEVPAMATIPGTRLPVGGVDVSGYTRDAPSSASKASKKSVSGIPTSTGGGGTTHIYGMAKLSDVPKSANEPSPGGSGWSPGASIAPGVKAAPVTSTKKDAAASAAGVGFGAGVSASPIGSLMRGIGGWFGW